MASALWYGGLQWWCGKREKEMVILLIGEERESYYGEERESCYGEEIEREREREREKERECVRRTE